MNDKKLVKKIIALSKSMALLSDIELQAQTEQLRNQIKLKVREDELIMMAFAVVREADRRILGLLPTEEQVLGALAIYHQKVAEIKTGEGKSLVATLPLYLKALILGHTFLVTTNDYLAQRDYERIGKVYEWLGLTVANGSTDSEGKPFDLKKKKEIYSAHIIYISNGALGFDFLIDGLADQPDARFMCPLNYALLDEVDEILLDSAQQPLVISGAPKVQSNYIEISNSFIQTLVEEKDYEIDKQKNQVWLTEYGIERAKQYFALPSLLGVEYFMLYQHLILALKANIILKKNQDYVVVNGEVKLLDRRNGRILEGTNLQSGLHQAIEAKEQVKITSETQIISSITFQTLFRQFRQLSGMSGTAKVAQNELIATYHLSVQKIKTHKKNIRKDHPAQKYVNFEAKLHHALKKIEHLHELNRPVLVITGSVEASDLFSMHLLNLNFPHNVLNARSSLKEAQIIKEAGRAGAITISTTMAGRGTDIKITDEALQCGGLAVIITERMLNQRVSLQAKGRAGRQGEPGDTYVFESLEDEVLKHYMQKSIQNYYDKNKKSKAIIRNWRIKRSFVNAQKKSEDQAYQNRLYALQFDETMSLQKAAVTRSRNAILGFETIDQGLELLKVNADLLMQNCFFEKSEPTEESFQRFILDHIDYNYSGVACSDTLFSIDEKKEEVRQLLTKNMEEKRKALDDDRVFLLFLKACMLKAVDIVWSNQVEALNQLRFVVQSRSAAQKKPLFEFEKEAQKHYEFQRTQVTKLIVKNVALSLLEIKEGELIIVFP